MKNRHLQVGLDYRPALVNREGIGRYARELVAALARLEDAPHLGLFGHTFGRRRFDDEELGLAGTRAELVRARIPARLLPFLMRRTGRGADDLVGGAHVYHHTQPNLLPVREAREVVTIFDCIYTLDAGFVEPETAERMTETALAMVRRARRVLVPCQYVGAEVVMALGAHPARVAVAELGCDHVLRHVPEGGFGPAKEPFLLTVSRVDPRKNHLRILEAFERLVREGYPHRWIIAGPRGWQCEVFERRLEASPARERVEWLGAVPEAELVRLYAQADALLFPSLNEGFGFPALEAMALGTPVVTSHVTSTGELCEGAAMMVEPTEVDDIALATRRVLDEPDLAAELVRLGRDRAAGYTWELCARKTLLAYQGAMKDDEADEPKLGYRL